MRILSGLRWVKTSEMARLIGPDLEPNEATVSTQCDAISIHADRNMLRQVLLNLLVNAARAIPRGGQIRLSATKEAEGQEALRTRGYRAGSFVQDFKH